MRSRTTALEFSEEGVTLYKRPLTGNIKRTPRTGSYPLPLDLPNYKITDHESGALDFKLRTTQWFSGSVI